MSVMVRDGRGDEAIQTYNLTVADDLNSAPQILSTRLFEAPSRRWYAYDVVADDAGGDLVFFQLLEHGPQQLWLTALAARVGPYQVA